MQQKQKRQVGQKPASVVLPVPPPFGGLNAVSAKASMPIQDAIVLDNYFPGPGGVTLRLGSRVWTTGGMNGAAVQTVAEWAGESSRKLIAAANGAFYECSTFNTTATSLATGFTSDIWQTAMFRNQLHFVNGADAPQMYNGSTISAPAWTGPTVTTLINVNIYRSRMYFVEKNSLSIWYGGVNAVSGALTEFDMQSIFQRGGSLSFMATWTRDSGSGADDLAVFVSDQGEVLVYQGANPTDSTWRLIGRFDTLTPLGRRCYATLGSDLVVGTVGGLIPLSKIMLLGQQDQLGAAITYKINKLFSSAAAVYGANPGWTVQVYPLGNYVLVNIPISVTAGSYASWQYVVNTLTGAWCRFLGMNAQSWCLFEDKLYFGTGSGTVLLADSGYSDGCTSTFNTNGTAITGNIKTAFYAYEMPGNIKRFLNVQPLISSNGEVSIALAVSVDYRDRAIEGTVSANTSGSPWDISPWDTTPWGDAVTVNRAWFGVAGVGHTAALRLNTMTTSNAIEVQGFNVMFEPGGPL